MRRTLWWKRWSTIYGWSTTRRLMLASSHPTRPWRTCRRPRKRMEPDRNRKSWARWELRMQTALVTNRQTSRSQPRRNPKGKASNTKLMILWKAIFKCNQKRQQADSNSRKRLRIFRTRSTWSQTSSIQRTMPTTFQMIRRVLQRYWSRCQMTTTCSGLPKMANYRGQKRGERSRSVSSRTRGPSSSRESTTKRTASRQRKQINRPPIKIKIL